MSRRTYLITVSILTCLCIYLGLKGLDNAMFWDDEAQVAVIAKNYLKTGELSGWDGRNLYAYRNGGLLDQNLNLKIQPLDILITAGSFKLFGISTWSARFPFAVLGLLCLGVMFLMLRREFDTEYELQLFIFTCFAFSCTFLLNIRQARYYSPVLLFSMLTYLAYQYYRSDHRYFWYLAMGILSILSFYANPMLCGAFLLSMAGYHGLFRRQKMDFQEWYGLASAIAIFLAAIVPYAILQQIWIRPDQEYVVKEIWWVRKLHLIQWNFRDLNSINLLPWLLVPIIIYFVVKPNKHENVLLRIRGWGFLGLINVFTDCPDFSASNGSPDMVECPVPVRVGSIHHRGGGMDVVDDLSAEPLAQFCRNRDLFMHESPEPRADALVVAGVLMSSNGCFPPISGKSISLIPPVTAP